MPETESPPKLMRRLDYSSALDDADNDNDGGGGADTKSPQQNLNQKAFTSPLPTTPQSRNRNTLSSRTSVLGRRLAEERSRNHQLTVELEHIKSLLEREMKRNIDVIAIDLNESFYSSSPVNTPNATPVKCGGGGYASAAAVHIEEEGNNDANNDNMHMQIERIQELELALKIETKLRKDAEEKLLEAEKHSKILEQEVVNNSLHIGIESPIREYLQRASHLINETNSSSNSNGSSPLPSYNGYKNGTHHSYNSLHSIDEDEEDNNEEDHHIPNTSLSNIVHKMQEYEELVTAFHSEQQNNRDEVLSKDDVLWFFEELKWRFADIIRGVVAVSKEPEDNSEEWKNCLIGLVDELEYSMQKTREQVDDNYDKHEANLGDESVAAMKISYEEQLSSQSQRIEQLEADAVERERNIEELQEKIKQDWLLIEEEKKKLSLSKDGTAARIRYLENMVQSLQVKLKKTQAQPDPAKVVSEEAIDSTSIYASEIDSLAKALADSELKRAQLIDEFQAEREKFITQYKQMNDILKQFMYAESNQS
eukprot:scaffold7490_cov142-Skeletonema_menzelii.AAC.7